MSTGITGGLKCKLRSGRKHAVPAGLERGPLPREGNVTLARCSPQVRRPRVWRAASSILLLCVIAGAGARIHGSIASAGCKMVIVKSNVQHFLGYKQPLSVVQNAQGQRSKSAPTGGI